MSGKTLRDIVEDCLLRDSLIHPFTPGALEQCGDGSFGLSNLSFALYSNGHNVRGKSTHHPYGLLYNDGKVLFSIGYFRKEHDPPTEAGYLFIVAPRGADSVRLVTYFSNEALQNSELPCKGVYVRFLSVGQYIGLLHRGFLPVKEHPWHDDSPEEDETLTNSLLMINDVLEGDGTIKTLPNGNNKSRLTHNRCKHFLARNVLTYTLRPYSLEMYDFARHILEQHFATLDQHEKRIGSTAEDHFNSIDLKFLELPSFKAYVGYLGDVPVSYFAGEHVSDSRFALYTPFTLRSAELVLPRAGITDNETKKGFSALPIFSYIELLKKLKADGIDEVLFGGSEHIDLNRIKRQLGCKNDPSYWAVKLR